MFIVKTALWRSSFRLYWRSNNTLVNKDMFSQKHLAQAVDGLWEKLWAETLISVMSPLNTHKNIKHLEVEETFSSGTLLSSCYRWSGMHYIAVICCNSHVLSEISTLSPLRVNTVRLGSITLSFSKCCLCVALALGNHLINFVISYLTRELLWSDGCNGKIWLHKP